MQHRFSIHRIEVTEFRTIRKSSGATNPEIVAAYREQPRDLTTDLTFEMDVGWFFPTSGPVSMEAFIAAAKPLPDTITREPCEKFTVFSVAPNPSHPEFKSASGAIQAGVLALRHIGGYRTTQRVSHSTNYRTVQDTWDLQLGARLTAEWWASRADLEASVPEPCSLGDLMKELEFRGVDPTALHDPVYYAGLESVGYSTRYAEVSKFSRILNRLANLKAEPNFGTAPPAAVSARRYLSTRRDRKTINKARGERVAQAVRDLIDTSYIDSEVVLDIVRDEFEHDHEAGKSFLANLAEKFPGDAADIECVTMHDCGHWHDEPGEIVHGADEVWCVDCVEERTERPEDREGVWAQDNLFYSDNHGAWYTYDIDAREAVDPDDDEDDEDDETGDRCTYGDPSGLLYYSTNPLTLTDRDESFTPNPQGPLLMGVELEMVLPGRQSKYIQAMRDQLGAGYAVFKADGSLPKYGAELVSGPQKLERHIQAFTHFRAPKGSRAWDGAECGMHVHIDSRGFTPLSLGKFVMFINRPENAGLIRKIAGRHPSVDSEADDYCQAIDSDHSIDPAKAKGAPAERYRMVNLTGLGSDERRRLGVPNPHDGGKYDTVELRIFRASLRKERMLAQLEFTDASVKFTRDASWSKLTPEAFLAWLRKHVHTYPNLGKWFSLVAPKATAQRPTPEVVTTDEDLLDEVEV